MTEETVVTPEAPAEETKSADERGRRKERQGFVVRASTPKTVVVEIIRRVQHARYRKFLNRRRRYAVHDTLGCQVGDQVLIQETRPLSKTKRWRVLRKIT